MGDVVIQEVGADLEEKMRRSILEPSGIFKWNSLKLKRNISAMQNWDLSIGGPIHGNE